IVNRHKGTIINIFDDMSEKDKEEFEAFKKRSPKYNPDMNNYDQTDGESEDIQHHDIDNNKAIHKDIPEQQVDDKNDKNADNKEEKHENGANNSEETKVK
ncbi:lipoprotein, partial [Staphylococcus aureus]